MTTIYFEERDLEASVPDLAAGGAWTRVRLRWRRDPLTGASARILTGVKLQPSTRPDMTELTAKPAFCPFDSEFLEKATVPFPAALSAEGRIRVGHRRIEAVALGRDAEGRCPEHVVVVLEVLVLAVRPASRQRSQLVEHVDAAIDRPLSRRSLESLRERRSLRAA